MKYKLILFLLVLVANFQAYTQAFTVFAGYSFHTTGDMNGFVNGFSYIFNNSSRFEYSVTIENSNHFRTERVRFFDVNGIVFDPNYEINADFNHITTGIQINPKVNLVLNKNSKNNFILSLGGLLRYQRKSFHSNYFQINRLLFLSEEYQLPPFRWDYDIINIDENITNIFTIGYSVDIAYRRKLNDKWSLILNIIGLQNDTKEELIWKIPIIGIVRKL